MSKLYLKNLKELNSNNNNKEINQKELEDFYDNSIFKDILKENEINKNEEFSIMREDIMENEEFIPIKFPKEINKCFSDKYLVESKIFLIEIFNFLNFIDKEKLKNFEDENLLKNYEENKALNFMEFSDKNFSSKIFF